MNVVGVVKEIIQPFWSMRPGHKCVIPVTEPLSGLISCPAECHLLRVFYDEDDNER
jgi:hypothetical protein